MKTSIKNRGIMAIAFVAFSLLFSTVALAHNGAGDTTPVEFKFIGNINNQPIFQLDMENVDNDEYTVTITDLDGTVLYSDKLKGKNISRKFRINTDEVDGNLRVEVKAKKSDKAEVYVINSTQRFVQETSVSKL